MREACVFPSQQSEPYLQRVSCEHTMPRACVKKRARVDCAGSVVYELPSSCGYSYTEQTGRYLNDRPREHARELGLLAGGAVAVHCSP